LRWLVALASGAFVFGGLAVAAKIKIVTITRQPVVAATGDAILRKTGQTSGRRRFPHPSRLEAFQQIYLQTGEILRLVWVLAHGVSRKIFGP
jgi:hypothetical protein